MNTQLLCSLLVFSTALGANSFAKDPSVTLTATDTSVMNCAQKLDITGHGYDRQMYIFTDNPAPTAHVSGSTLTLAFRTQFYHCSNFKEVTIPFALTDQSVDLLDVTWQTVWPWSQDPTKAVRINNEPTNGLWQDIEIDLDYEMLLKHFKNSSDASLWLTVGGQDLGFEYDWNINLTGLRTPENLSLNLTQKSRN